ncbi:enoyl-CoA hydratase/carnithine racemase [Mycobacterium sp. MAA66]|uniref:enoyl-CoA hydratase/isomerase family protein n=1 Tax=Mycobacterium sp. MAA66 TaxID=3156297 RepID=UPI0035148FED
MEGLNLSSTGTSVRAVPAKGGLRVEHPAEGVRVLVLDRPERRNSLDAEVLARLADELERVRTDSGVRVLILTGGNGVFSAGADFSQLENLSQLAESEVAELLGKVMLVGEMLWALPQPTIAAIDGPAVGAGMSLALACDIRVGSRSMTLFPSFIRMGLLPDTGASWFLPRLIGEGAALQMFLAGRPVDADSAQQLGLVNRLCDNAFSSAVELAAMFAARPATAVMATKRLLRDAARRDLARAIELEGVMQATAIHGDEFADTFSGWRMSRSAD